MPTASPFAEPRPWLVAITLCAVGVCSHLLPHPAGMSSIGAIGLLAAAYLPRHLIPLPVIASAAAADALIGAYSTAAMALVYLGHIACAVGVAPLLRTIGALQVGGAAIVSAIIFYLISNAAPMVMEFYPNTLAGWLSCYAAGIPFLLRSIAANLIFSVVAFGSIRGLWFVLRRWAPMPN